MKSKYTQHRLLCIVGSLDAGGAETFLMKIYRNLDKNKFQMDFFCMALEKGFYEKEIEELGGKVFHSIPKSKGFIKTFINLARVVKDNEYKYVMRVSQHSLATLDLLVAKLSGAEVLIQRSSNSNSSSSFGHVLHKIFKMLPKIVPNIKLAPSTEAAEYTFGKGCVEEGTVKLIKNAINIEQFVFDPIKRKKIRRELKLNDKLVIGHIGRFSNQKNHFFLIEIFHEIYKKNSNSVLVLVGKGELENPIREKINSLGLLENVIFMGVRSDIPEILMAMDIFVFPSFYEGMPNTVIEAQATGLPCIISDKITEEVRITDIVEFMSINRQPKEWAKAIINYSKCNDRMSKKDDFIRNGYDINSESKKIIDLIFYE